MSITRERVLQILDRNATKFAEHTEQLKAMATYHEDRMAELRAHAKGLDAHADILDRGLFGRLKWLLRGR